MSDPGANKKIGEGRRILVLEDDPSVQTLVRKALGAYGFEVTVADDVVFAGSYNLSRSGEQNAENVVKVESPELADRLVAFIDQTRALYEAADLTPPPEGR